MSQPHTARAVITNPQGQILLIERHNAGKHYFVLPGGHIDQNETPEQAVVREVREETGLSVTIQKLLRTETDGLGNTQHIYSCNYNGGKPMLHPHSIEAQVMQQGRQSWRPGWFSPNALAGQTVYPDWLFDALRQ